MKKTARKETINRIHRLVGQLRGIEKMIDEDEDIKKVLIQIDAAKASLDSFKRSYVREYVRFALQEKLESILDLL